MLQVRSGHVINPLSTPVSLWISHLSNDENTYRYLYYSLKEYILPSTFPATVFFKVTFKICVVDNSQRLAQQILFESRLCFLSKIRSGSHLKLN